MENKKNDFSIKNLVIVLTITLFAAFFFLSETSSKNTMPAIGVFMGLVAVMLSGLFLGEKFGLAIGIIAPALGFLGRFQFYSQLGISEKAIERYQAFSSILAPYAIPIIILSGALGFGAGFVAKKFKESSQKSESIFTTNVITKAAMFIALGVVINSLRIGFLSFGGFPIIFSGFALGPVVGFIVGGVTDVIAFIVRPSAGGFNPVFTLTSALTGLIPVLVVRFLGEGKNIKDYSFVKVLIGIAVGQIITSVILVPIFIQIFFQTNLLSINIAKAAIKQAYSVPLYAFLFISIKDALTRQLQPQN